MGTGAISESRAIDRLARALLPLLWRAVSASVIGPGGNTLASMQGVLECAYELPWRSRGPVFVISVGVGTLQVRPEEVSAVRCERASLGGEPVACIAVQLADGAVLVVQEDLGLGLIAEP